MKRIGIILAALVLLTGLASFTGCDSEKAHEHKYGEWETLTEAASKPDAWSDDWVGKAGVNIVWNYSE